MPRDASVNGDGFRMYSWPGGDTELHHKYNATQPTDVLSVTSIRTLAGLPFQLVNWQIANVVNLAMGVRKQTRIGPRGGVSEVYVKDGEFPGEFIRRMRETKGDEIKLDSLRKWLRDTADEPRDIAAVRGSVTHKLIEINAPLDRLDEAVITGSFDQQWRLEKRRSKPDVTEEDISFVLNCMRQYWDMRANVPFVILAQEPQVWNLTAGYAGSADVLIWFLGEWVCTGGEDGDDPSVYEFQPLDLPEGQDQAYWQKQAGKGLVTLETVQEVGGVVALGDWKTSKAVYTNHVVQGTAYMAAEFVGSDGEIDERLTKLLVASTQGMLIHIRPNEWGVEFFDFEYETLRAFLGSVAFSRFLAVYKKPDKLFTHTIKGVAPGTDESKEIDDAA